MHRARISSLQWIVYLGGWLPFLWLCWAAANNHLTINPIQAAEQRTGQFALIFLLLSLAATPANTLFGFRQAIRVRRALGLFAFFYAALHFSIFIGIDYSFDWTQILETITQKRYIVVGFSALIILVSLAATSFKWWMAKLGKNWKILHRLIYLAAPLVILHFAWARKGDIFRLSGDVFAPALAGLILVILLILRIPPVRRTASNLQKRIRMPRLFQPPATSGH
jgi:sulfoxide reductase heme-binding subunit YedZ